MMTSRVFKKTVTHAFVGLGFSAAHKVLRRPGDGVTMVVGFERGFGHQWFISVGFWIHALGSEVPSAVEKTHLYSRLDRLFPQLREVILMAGCLTEDGQPDALAQLIELLATDAGATLDALLSVEGISAAFHATTLEAGLVTKEARAYLVR